MTDAQAATGLRVRCLVPDLDDELLAVIRQVEEILTAIDPGQPGEPDALPEPLAGDEALRAMLRIWDLVRSGQGEDAAQAGYGRLLAPNGRLELLPLRVVDLPAEDLAVLAAGGALLLQLYDRGDDLVVDVIHDLAPDGRHLSGSKRDEHERYVAGALARVHGLLTAVTDPHTDPAVEADAVLLIGRLSGDPRADVTLASGEYEAYRRVAVAANTVWTGSPIDLIKYGFFV
ncbi:hypothetical protein [Micromonospora sp. NPDC051141]|uniref:hypothetical protein n=1 Tax=Micromonospora sp. NPDC051141 TaxID=3364284 RepID=UPI0037AD129A